MPGSPAGTLASLNMHDDKYGRYGCVSLLLLWSFAYAILYFQLFQSYDLISCFLDYNQANDDHYENISCPNLKILSWYCPWPFLFSRSGTPMSSHVPIKLVGQSRVTLLPNDEHLACQHSGEQLQHLAWHFGPQLQMCWNHMVIHVISYS